MITLILHLRSSSIWVLVAGAIIRHKVKIIIFKNERQSLHSIIGGGALLYRDYEWLIAALHKQYTELQVRNVNRRLDVMMAL